MVGPVRLNQDLRELPYIPAQRGIRRATSDALSARDRRATSSNGDSFFAVVAKAA